MESINKIYLKLLRLSIVHLLGRSCEDSRLNETEIYKLLSYASLISLSSDDNELIKAYEIISRVIEVSEIYSEGVIAAADIVLSRIGNFPGRKLMRDRFNSGLEPKLNMHLSFERIAREAENLHEGHELTDFQYNLLSSLKNAESLSVSAPTSAGKSFVLTLNTLRSIRDNPKGCIVYIVPTRALISETSSNLRRECRKAGLDGVIIRTSPVTVEYNKVKNGVVYVLTQERLISLLSDMYDYPNSSINLLLIDEAHEIQKGKRGIILQNAIELAIEMNPNINLMFSSPLISNPKYFLSLFKKERHGLALTETISPVAQNILLVNKVKGKVKGISVSALFDRDRVEIGEFDIGFSFRGNKVEQKASFSKYVAESGGSVIIFESNPADAEAIAICLSGKLTKAVLRDEFVNFIDFVRKEIHLDYPLAACLEAGVAFHYGNMPSIIRNGVEHFFKEGDVKYIICTSTLLQGVNLPAKHIILENPKSGTEPMSRSDFQNLSGRAGRLMREFHGNVWCLRADEWELKSFEGEKLQEISSAMSNVMFDGGELILNTIEGYVKDDTQKELADVAFAKLYHELKRDGYVSSYYLNPADSANYMEILEYNHGIIDELLITVPDAILKMHRSIRPDYIQNLWDFFDSKDNISPYFLYSPYIKGGKKRIDMAIDVCRDVFDWRISDKYCKWISVLAYKWMRAGSLNSLISYSVNEELSSLDRVKAEEDPVYVPKKISGAVRRVLNTLENQVRFNLVRYIKVYQDVLTYKMKLNGLDIASEKVENISAYLEFGSCKPVDLKLMSLGISRSTALIIRKKMNLPTNATPEEYVLILNKRNLKSLKLPDFCLREINEVLGNSFQTA
ncbi:DEAD/DEAH box helicase [Erwinia sp. 198]|uniref:DEAD/DEAH box helicase n=1 Tax=Erwinia sp. 198 TaxID=2022746 RepID=UPI000F67C759|nr:DEAD/DEAH box helicase [Erwinia sp. 198]RRZ92322.1 DEAD/DEAH box helicase [Erwinia sp. 198]